MGRRRRRRDHAGRASRSSPTISATIGSVELNGSLGERPERCVVRSTQTLAGRNLELLIGVADRPEVSGVDVDRMHAGPEFDDLIAPVSSNLDAVDHDQRPGQEEDPGQREEPRMDA